MSASLVQTVLGPIPAADLGVTLMHEHLSAEDATPPAPRPAGEEVDSPPGEPYVPPRDPSSIAQQVRQARERFGLRTIVDCSPAPSRNLRSIRQVAEEAGVHVVVSTGCYKEPRVTAFVHQSSVDEVAAFFERELVEGIDGTDVRAGIIKVGSSMCRITPVEEKVLRAAARAHRRTGAPITTHATVGTMGPDQVAIFQDEGVDLERVVIGHSDLNDNPAYHEAILRPGATVGFDTIGKEHFVYVRTESAGQHRYAFEQEAYFIPDWVRRQTLAELLRRGYVSQVVLSSDISWRESVLNRATLGSWGYSYVLGWFTRTLERAGVDQGALQQMLVENPRRILGR